VDDGQVKVEYRHYAVLGPESRLMAQGTECAGEQGEFWKYHDAIFQERTREIGVQGQIARANTIGLDIPKFTACMENETYEHIVDGDLAQAREDGVTTQPTIFILSGDQMTKFVGARAFDVVSAVIDEYLGSAY
jgi:protein-disulfide isomerase